jgi:hypothetical protein
VDEVFHPGEHWVVEGVILGQGAILLQRGGFMQALYMACNSARRPQGPWGSFSCGRREPASTFPAWSAASQKSIN